MARTRTLADLVNDVRQRTNQEESDLCTDEEIGEYLNQEIAELWSHVVNGAGQPYYRNSQPYPVLVGTALYALPADFWRAQEVTGTYAGRTFTLRPFMPAERADLIDSIAWPYSGQGGGEMYRIQGTQIEFQPNRIAFAATLFYTPICPRLAMSDPFDGINGWEVAAIYGACATVQAKEETDPSFYLSQRERIYNLIDNMVPHRDGGEPERIQDVNPRRNRRGRGGW